MARKKKHHVEYFPHDTKQSKAVRIISKKYGNDGYAFYYKLRELLGRTDNYNYDLSENIDWFDFLSEMNVEEKQAKQLIEFLVTIGELDKELWEQDKRLWSNSLIEDISDVYDKRVAEIPHKYSFRDGNTDSRIGNPSLGDGSTQSRVKEKKVNKSKVVVGETSETHTTIDLKAFADKYKTVDISLSHNKFNLYQQSKGVKSNNVKADFERWVLNDIENGWNLKPPEINKMVKRYCPNMHGSVDVLSKELHKGVFCIKCKEQMVHESELVKTNSIPF